MINLKNFSNFFNKKANSIIPIFVALIGFLIFLPFYPGVFSYSDSFAYWSGAAIQYWPMGNWHPPLFSYLWRLLGSLGGLLVFNLFCYWLGISLIALALLKSIYSRILFLIFIGFFPNNVVFLYHIVIDGTILSSLFLSFGLVATYLYRFKRVSLLWFSLLALTLAMGLKQSVVAYALFFAPVPIFLLAKHYIRFLKLPFLRLNKKNFLIIFLSIFLLQILSVNYINGKYDKDDQLFWSGFMVWELMADSVYSGKNLFYPDLIKPEYTDKKYNQILYQAIQKELNPYQNTNVWGAPETNKLIKNFTQLSVADKIIAVNQISSNPAAYLYHRYLVTKVVLKGHSDFEPLENYTNWNSIDISAKVNPFNSHLDHFYRFLLTEITMKLTGLYLLISIFFLLALIKFPPLNYHHNLRERYLILCLSLSSLILLVFLFFLSPSDEFRYFLPALFSFQIILVLFLMCLHRSFTKKIKLHKLKENMINLRAFFKNFIKLICTQTN